MSENIEFHECIDTGMPEPVLIMREKGDSKYYICVEPYGDWIEINYCPFCGERIGEELR